MFVLPDWKGQFLASLERGIAEVIMNAPQNRTEVRTIRVPNHDHTQLSRMLADLNPDDVDGLSIKAKETP